MKLREWMYQAAIPNGVNVLSPEIIIVAGVDTFHIGERQHCCNAMAMEAATCRGLRQWHGTRWKLCKLGRSIGFLGNRYAETSSGEQELANDPMEVGLIGSTPRTGKPFTWESGQQECDSSDDVRANTQRLEVQHA